MSRSMRVNGPSSVNGTLSIPGDKSISHRAAMLASVANGKSTLRGFASSADCQATLDCIRKLGVAVEATDEALSIYGAGLSGYQPGFDPVHLYAANSGSTIRMLSGLLAGQSFSSKIDGDESLRRRPMNRIINPLRQMGARIEAASGGHAPLQITGGKLRPISYVSSVASAQVKTCVLLAGLYTPGSTAFFEPSRSRDHTELMLAEAGAKIQISDQDRMVSIQGGCMLEPLDYDIPGDVSSAAFFAAAATVLPGSRITLRSVGLNPTRTAFLEILGEMGADIDISNRRSPHREPVGDITLQSHKLRTVPSGIRLAGDLIPNLIDEVPILAVVATQSEGRLELREARELRLKESDRIKTIVDGIRGLGGKIEEFEDGFAIEGPQLLTGGRVQSAGDHRIAMAFTIAGLAASGVTEIVDSDCASVSFPEFYELLGGVANDGALFYEPAASA